MVVRWLNAAATAATIQHRFADAAHSNAIKGH